MDGATAYYIHTKSCCQHRPRVSGLGACSVHAQSYSSHMFVVWIINDNIIYDNIIQPCRGRKPGALIVIIVCDTRVKFIIIIKIINYKLFVYKSRINIL